MNSPATQFDWDRFVGVLTETVPGWPPGTSSTEVIAEVFPGTVERSIFFGVVGRLGRGLPDELIRTIVTVGDAFEWCQARWAGESFPSTVDPESFPDAGPARVALVPIEPGHLPQMYRASVDPDEGFRWRFRGSTPSFAEFQARLYEGVLCSFVVVDRNNGTTHGWVTAYNARFDAGHAWIGFVRFPGAARAGEMTEGLFLLLEHLFSRWAFRKVYAEVPEYNWVHLIGGKPGDAFLFPIEGRLVGHEYNANRWWDLLTVAIWRERWEEVAGPWRPFLVREPDGLHR